MKKKRETLIFSLITLSIISLLPMLVSGTLDNGTQVIFDLTYTPTQVLPEDDVIVTCEVIGVFNTTFTDEFERAEIGSDWTDTFGEWTIENGNLIQNEIQNDRLIFTGNSSWSNYRFKLKVKKVETVENNLNIIFRKGFQNNLTDLYILSFRDDGATVAVYKGSGDHFQSSEWPRLDQKNFQHSADIWYDVLIQVIDDTFKIKIWNEVEHEPVSWLLKIIDTTYESGKIGLSCSNQAAFDDIEVYTYKSNFLIQEISLWYNVNNGTFNQMGMNLTSDGQYNVTIPKQTEETQVSFYFEIVNDVGNSINSETITYVVQTLPPPQIPWFTILLSGSAIVTIIVIWFAFRKGYLAIEIVE